VIVGAGTDVRSAPGVGLSRTGVGGELNGEAFVGEMSVVVGEKLVSLGAGTGPLPGSEVPC